jgi:glycosyltransferase involved in cell wall biosynthesis
MDVLVVSPWLPSSGAKAGAPRAIYDRIALLARDHAVTVAAMAEPTERSSIAELERLGVAVRTVVRRRPRSSARGVWRKRARLVLGLVTDRRPMLVQELDDPRLCRLLRDLTTGRGFDVVLVEHLLAASSIDCLAGPCASRVVLTDHDVRVAFPAPGGPDTNARPKPARRLIAWIDRRKWRAYARRSYARAALVTVPTAEDAATISSEVPARRLEIVPFGIAPAAGPEDPGAGSTAPPLPGEDSVLFVGGFDHAPNRDAAGWLCSAVMPAVWARRPEATVWLVGRDPTPVVRALAGPRVVVTGEVPSVERYIRAATVFAAPLREGGGVRIKLLEALATGAAVVTTSLGARGLGAEAGEHLLVADDAAGLAAAIVDVLEDDALRARLIASGHALVLEDDRDRRARALDRVLARVAGGAVPEAGL